MTERRVFEIAGAGPAGLAAAIVLARRGCRVRVYERSARLGSRFHDDFQGLENWSTDGDCLSELRSFGIEATWWQRPFRHSDLLLGTQRSVRLQSDEPLFYLTRRGSAHRDSLDNALRRQAEDAGAELCLGLRADPANVDIFAGGPSGRPMALVRGLTFAVDLPDTSSTLLCPHLAPQGYVYFLAAGGTATLGTVLLADFREANVRLQRAVSVIESLHGLRVPAEAVPWGGYARFGIPASARQGRSLLVGEAGGFQDALFGFGIRSAMVSGALAARTLIDGGDYDSAWQQRLLGSLRASQVNRTLYDLLGDAPGALWQLFRRLPDGHRALRPMYGGTALHRLAWPLAEWHFRHRYQAAGYKSE